MKAWMVGLIVVVVAVCVVGFIGCSLFTDSQASVPNAGGVPGNTATVTTPAPATQAANAIAAVAPIAPAPWNALLTALASALGLGSLLGNYLQKRKNDQVTSVAQSAVDTVDAIKPYIDNSLWPTVKSAIVAIQQQAGTQAAIDGMRNPGISATALTPVAASTPAAPAVTAGA